MDSIGFHEFPLAPVVFCGFVMLCHHVFPQVSIWIFCICQQHVLLVSLCFSLCYEGKVYKGAGSPVCSLSSSLGNSLSFLHLPWSLHLRPVDSPRLLCVLCSSSSEPFVFAPLRYNPNTPLLQSRLHSVSSFCGLTPRALSALCPPPQFVTL